MSDDLLYFLSHRPQISNFPLYFRLPISEKIFFPPPLANFPPHNAKFTCFLHTFCLFRFPPILTMLHLCIIQCTYWTLLIKANCTVPVNAQTKTFTFVK